MKRRLLVLGAGTAGTVIANKLRRKLDVAEWDITIVDRDDIHPYQPGYLFLPFETYSPDQINRSRRSLLPTGVDFVIGEVDRVDGAADTVTLEDGRTLTYDYLVIASGTSPAARPDARDARGRVASQHLRLLQLRRSSGTGHGLAGVRPRPTRRAHHRDADQVPGRPLGVHVPGGSVAA